MRVPRSIAERAVFVDASAFHAYLDSSDRQHAAALDAFGQLAAERRPLFTSNLVAAETYALARRRLGAEPAVRWLTSLAGFNLIFQEPSDHERVILLLQRYSDKKFSYTDACSFVVMERLGLPVALAFDRDIQQYGVPTLP